MLTLGDGMRDCLNNEVNLRFYIDYYAKNNLSANNSIKQLEEDIRNGVKRFPNENVDIIYSKRKHIFNNTYSLINAHYSFGEDCSVLEKLYYDELVAYTYVSHDIGYIHLVQFLSLGVLLEIPKDKMQAMVDEMDAININDRLIDFIIDSYGLKRAMISDGYMFGNPYPFLMDVISTAYKDKEKASVLLVEYIENKWMDGHAKCGWKKFHKEAGYVGLWSFEAGAVAKILGLDDSELKNSNHYPYDLVHYKDDCQFDKVSTNSVADSASKVVFVKGISNCPNLEAIIPERFHEGVERIIVDYKTLSDNEMWSKHNLSNIWFTVDEYVEEKSSRELLGFIIVNYLVDEGYILQLDYKENPDDYIEDMESYWVGDVKVISFDLDNDQLYLAKVPCNADFQNIYEVAVKGYRK